MLITRLDKTAVLYPRLYGEVGYYACLASCPNAVIDTYARFDKRRKQTHRFSIADARGRHQLTVPVGKPDVPNATWRDIPISDHGNWWNVHRTGLESAYGRTPFFEFYIDRFLPLMQPQGSPGMPETVGGLIEASDALIRSVLGLQTHISYGPSDGSYDDVAGSGADIEYYQVREASLGFIPGLSILDAIFNLGPETPLLLRRFQQLQ